MTKQKLSALIISVLCVESCTMFSRTESKENKLKIYPNPTDNSFKLLYSNADESETQYRILDLLGKEVARGAMHPNISHEINALPFNNGIYFITLIQNTKLVEKQKLIIMK